MVLFFFLFNISLFKQNMLKTTSTAPAVDGSLLLPRPRATLLIPDGGVLATRVHYETLNDAMFLLRVTLLSSVLCLLTVVLLSLATANVDLKLGIMALPAYPKLIFSSPVWSSTSVFSAIQVAWFMAYCVFSHLIRIHFNTTDPPREWDDRNGEWSVIELDVRPSPKRHQDDDESEQLHLDHHSTISRHVHFETSPYVPASNPHFQQQQQQQQNSDAEIVAEGHIPPPSTHEDDTINTVGPVSEQWRLCVSPTRHTGGDGPIPVQADIALLTPDPDYLAWMAVNKQKM